jgi:hypothetical protein
MPFRQRGRLAAAAVASVVLTAGLALGPSALAASGSATVTHPEDSSGIAGWTTAGSYLEPTLTSNEGVATVDPPGGSAYELYRGTASIPLSLAIQGWTHIGDPDLRSRHHRLRVQAELSPRQRTGRAPFRCSDARLRSAKLTVMRATSLQWWRRS